MKVRYTDPNPPEGYPLKTGKIYEVDKIGKDFVTHSGHILPRVYAEVVETD